MDLLMIHLLYNKNHVDAIHIAIPDELYSMMNTMKFTISLELETKTATKFDLPLLRNIAPNTTPNNRIVRTTETYIQTNFMNTTKKDLN